MLAELARQFGEATGKRGALRNAIGQTADPTILQKTNEPHDRGSILVAAVFDAFLTVYKSRIADLMRIATGGTGILPEGAIHPDLVNRMAEEAADVSQHVLWLCILALDYSPPVDITFGEYLRAIVTASFDTDPDDRNGYRIAVVESFRRRGIYPTNVRSLSGESLLWFPPENDEVLMKFFDIPRQEKIQQYETIQKRNRDHRQVIFSTEGSFRRIFRDWVLNDLTKRYLAKHQSIEAANQVIQNSLNLVLWPDEKFQSIYLDTETGRPELGVNSVRLAHRVDQSGQPYTDLVVELNQRRRGYLDPDEQAAVDSGKAPAGKAPAGEPDFIFRGGATMTIDIETGKVRYIITKSVDSNRRLGIMRQYLTRPEMSLAYTYFGKSSLNYFKGAVQREPFAILHGSGIELEE